MPLTHDEDQARPCGPRTAVVVVNYGASDLIDANLAALDDEVRAGRLRVVIVDNLSDAAERERITALGGRRGWAVVAAATNLGFGAGVNLGVAHARRSGATRFLVLNPDARIEPDSVALLEAASERAPMALLSPVVLGPDGRPWFSGADLYLADGRIRSRRRRMQGAEVEPWLSGAVLFCTAELWDAVGGFAEEYFLYWEDVDLSWRTRRAGGELVVLEAATAVHDEGGTQSRPVGGRAKSTTYYYWMIRNRLLFAALHLDPDRRRSWRAASGPVAYEVLLQGGRRQFLTQAIPVIGAALRGLRDGRRLLRERSGA